MEYKTTILLFSLFKIILCQNLENLFQNINKETGKLNAIAANIAWESSIKPGNPELPIKSATYQKKRLTWQHQTCDKLGTLFNHQLLNDTQKRQSYLLCRGPEFTFDEAILTSNIYDELQSIYSDAEVCIPNVNSKAITNLSSVEDAILNYLSNVKQYLNLEQNNAILFAAKIAVNTNLRENRLCFKGENDFEKMMRFSRKEEVLRWLWLTWREKVGPPMKEPYRRMVDVENRAAKRNGYPNIGASWRDELELPHLRQHCRHLYNNVKRLYVLLHGVVRFYLRRYYGDVVPKRGLIPAHLLSNLWSQNWEPLADLILPKNINLDSRIKDMNWTVEHMVRRAEDFYQSLGLAPMTDKFWRESIFSRENNDVRCHGTAADMFQDGDYRLLYCSDTTKEDFYVLHHELGHIQYYMAYAHQPALFRQANTALHESIGDSIMYGVLTPQHLNRLGLINDSLLYTPNFNADLILKVSINIQEDKDDGIEPELDEKANEDNKVFKETGNNYIKDTNHDAKLKTHNIFDEVEDQNSPELFTAKDLTTDIILLFKQALNKLPQIPFALAIDEYRWKYFEGSLKKENKGFWNLVEELQGVGPVGERGEEYFDVGAKFHVPDNTPYIRYFLSSFLQHQLFEKLCKAAVFGQRGNDNPIPDTISLHRCDIYGSKAAGKVLKDLMSRGHSQHWSEILQATIHQPDISASALMNYYHPLYDVLNNFVSKHQIPIGW